MAWESMHFAVGMAGGGALCAGVWLSTRRGWRAMPLAMTLGGLWAIVPDLPRFFRWHPSIPGMRWFASYPTEHFLHRIGDVFFLHRSLDHQPADFALLGLAGIIGLYSASAVFIYVMYEHRLRKAPRRSHGPTGEAHRAVQPVNARVGDGVLARIGKSRSGNAGVCGHGGTPISAIQSKV